MTNPTVAFQGERGSFSEEAARKLLGLKVRVRPCETFAGIFESAATGKTRFCLAPIENTLAGPVYENYDLQLEHNLHIIAEFSLRIVHNLIALHCDANRDPRGPHQFNSKRLIAIKARSPANLPAGIVGAGDSARQALAKSLAALPRPQILSANSPVEEPVKHFQAMAAGRQTQVLFETQLGINQTKVRK